jgi:hypothetical protein
MKEDEFTILKKQVLKKDGVDDPKELSEALLLHAIEKRQ